MTTPLDPELSSDRRFWMVRLGQGARFADAMRSQDRIGVDFVGAHDLSQYLTQDAAEFHKAVGHLAERYQPGRSNIAIGLSVGNLWVATCAILDGDVVVSGLGNGTFAIGIVNGRYIFDDLSPLPHQRPVQWVGSFSKADVSATLAKSLSTPMTVYSLNGFADELDGLMGRSSGGDAHHNETAAIQSSVEFRLERQLEDFLFDNWRNTSLGAEFDLFTEGDLVGRQIATDTGPLDLLAVSKDRSRVLVIELKRGRPSDDVVGQILRYMGWVSSELASPDQTVEGVIIAFEEDIRVRRALQHVPNVRFMTYRLEFKLDEVQVERIRSTL